MLPGRKPQPVAEEPPLTDYEKRRLNNIPRNDQKYHSLGLNRLKGLLGQPSEKTKAAKNKATAHKDKEGLADEVLEKNLPDNTTTLNTLQCGGTRSKRVLATIDQPARLTRQRTKDLQSEGVVHDSTTNAQEDELIVVDGPTQPDVQIELCNEGQQNALEKRWIRGRSMGKGLERLTHSLCAKIPIHIAEGNKWPEAPMQAAKFASEGGIILRQHFPILPHWKEYKKNKNYLKDYMGKVSAQFAIDTNDKAVIAACADLLKSGQRQLRYKLKKAYFDGVPANEVPRKSPLSTISDEQWQVLLDLWFSEKHQKKCAANKQNREKVKYHHRTGSRCYLAQAHVLKQQDEYQDVPPTAIDLFKNFNCSSKVGFSEPVKDAIEQMEAILDQPVEEGQVSKTPEEIVAQVLPSTKFLQNAGLEPPTTKREKTSVSAAHVEYLEAKLAAEEQGSAALKEKIEALEEAREQQQQDMDELNKQLQENNTFLRRMFGADRE